ncbi:hypothetical protein GCM10017687_53490 [Streptomyces echinatus]
MAEAGVDIDHEAVGGRRGLLHRLLPAATGNTVTGEGADRYPANREEGLKGMNHVT